MTRKVTLRQAHIANCISILADLITLINSIALGLQTIVTPSAIVYERTALVGMLLIWIVVRNRTTSVMSPNRISEFVRYALPWLILPFVVSSTVRSLPNADWTWLRGKSPVTTDILTSSVTPSVTPSLPPTVTATLTATVTPSYTPTHTATATLTATVTPSYTHTSTLATTPTATQ